MSIDRDPQSSSGGYCPTRFRLWFVGLATVLLPAFLFSGPSAAAAAAPQFTKLTPSSSSTTSVDWAVADFNGDRIPDLVSTETQAGLGRNTLYRVKLQLSGGEGSAFDIRVSERPGLNISARDIDGDNDLDLVITSGIFRRPIGIWLNDGKGSFTQTDASAYASNVWQDPPILVQNEILQQGLSAILVQARYLYPSPQTFLFEVPSGKTGPPRGDTVQARSRLICCPLYVRPPPFETIPAI